MGIEIGLERTKSQICSKENEEGAFRQDDRITLRIIAALTEEGIAVISTLVKAKQGTGTLFEADE